MARFTPHGPTNYGESVRMPAEMYLGRSVMGIISAGLTFLLVLLVILPIIKHRLESVIVVSESFYYDFNCNIDQNDHHVHDILIFYVGC